MICSSNTASFHAPASHWILATAPVLPIEHVVVIDDGGAASSRHGAGGIADRFWGTGKLESACGGRAERRGGVAADDRSWRRSEAWYTSEKERLLQSEPKDWFRSDETAGADACRFTGVLADSIGAARRACTPSAMNVGAAAIGDAPVSSAGTLTGDATCMAGGKPAVEVWAGAEEEETKWKGGSEDRPRWEERKCVWEV
jgi:hypothetical protein